MKRGDIGGDGNVRVRSCGACSSSATVYVPVPAAKAPRAIVRKMWVSLYKVCERLKMAGSIRRKLSIYDNMMR